MIFILKEVPQDSKFNEATRWKNYYQVNPFKGSYNMVDRVTNIKRNPDLIASIVGILTLNLIALSPVLVSGWYHDDYINSFMRGTMGIEGVNLLQFIKIRHGWWISDGRFWPISQLYFIIFWLFSYPVYLLKGVYVLGTMLASISFFIFIRKLTTSFWFALLPIALLPIIFQYRSYHDPLTAYHLFMQVSFIQFIISVHLFLRYFKAEKKSYLLLGFSVLFYLIFLLTYEISLLFILFYIIIALYFEKSISGIIRNTWPFILCVLIVFLITLYLRANATFQLEQYNIKFSAINAVITWINQIASTSPFSYALLNDRGMFLKIIPMLSVWDIIFFVAFGVAFYFIYNRLDRFEHKWILFIFSILFIVLPGLLMTLSPKYQAEIKAGNGYIPVFFQYYGGALLIAIGLAYFKQKLSAFRGWKILASAIAIAISMMFVVNLKININSIEQLNTTWYYSRSVLEQSLRRGIFDHIPSKSLILNQDRYIPYFTSSGFFYQFTGREYSTQDFYDFMTEFFDKEQLSNDDAFTLPISDEVYLIDYHALNNSQGYVLLSKVKEISGTRSSYGVKVDRAQLFLLNSNDGYSQLQNYILENQPVPSGYRAIISIADAPLSSLKISNNVNEKILPRESKIKIAAPRTGNSNVITISGTDGQPFTITDIQMVPK